MAASKFYIMNEKSVRWSLNSQEQGIFTEPSGFGIEYDNSYLNVGDIWMPNSSELKQPSPSGNILFAKDKYPVYQQFVNFLNAARKLVFVYVKGVDRAFVLHCHCRRKGRKGVPGWE